MSEAIMDSNNEVGEGDAGLFFSVTQKELIRNGLDKAYVEGITLNVVSSLDYLLRMKNEFNLNLLNAVESGIPDDIKAAYGELVRS